MKHIIFIACLTCFSSFFSLKASAHILGVPINLKGKLSGGLVRLPQIEACQNATGVEIIFNCDLGI